MGHLVHNETKIAREAMNKAGIVYGRIYTQPSVSGLAGNGKNTLLFGLYGKSAASVQTALNEALEKGYHVKHYKTFNRVFHTFLLIKDVVEDKKQYNPIVKAVQKREEADVKAKVVGKPTKTVKQAKTAVKRKVAKVTKAK